MSVGCCKQDRADDLKEDRTMTWTGGCLCGAVRYQADADPIRAVICHCVTCRRVSGAPVLCFVHFPIGAFRWVSGQPTRYRSSANAERGFCVQCGSTLTMHEAVLGDRVQVAIGSLDNPERVRPDDHVWTQQQLPWLRIEDGLPRFPTISPAVPSRAVET
jgi:hypothetical protein